MAINGYVSRVESSSVLAQVSRPYHSTISCDIVRFSILCHKAHAASKDEHVHSQSGKILAVPTASLGSRRSIGKASEQGEHFTASRAVRERVKFGVEYVLCDTAA